MRTEPELSFINWTATVKADLQDAGFEVSEYASFPFIATPNTFIEKVKMLKVRISVPVSIRLYKEGALFVPAGSDRVFDELQEARPAR